MSRNSVLIIPSLNPDETLVPYIENLIADGFRKIIVVDDGSRQECSAIFASIGCFKECDVLVHTVNMGKGRALKNAFNFYCQKYAGEFKGVITVDSDGQHTLEDVERLDAVLKESPDALVLGVRNFDDPSVPFKSKFGNKLTKYVMRFFIGSVERQDLADKRLKGISDTQTGLRAVPNQIVKTYLTLYGERFEYETNMLIEALHTHTPIREIGIQTVYINENKETHFRAVADSLAIYRLIFSVFFKYMLASLSAFFIDYGAYCMIVFLLGSCHVSFRIWTATLAARALSSFYNYTVNMAVVFQELKNRKRTLARYYVLCVLQAGCSASLVWLACRQFGISEMTAKIFADTFLFLFSFYMQKNWVFKGGGN